MLSLKSKPSTIIFLNGVGSTGKSTIARKLQDSLPESYLHVGIDNFIYMMHPTRYFGFQKNNGFQLTNVGSDTVPEVRISIGKEAQKLVTGMHHAIAGLANAGNNLIIDEVLIDNQSFKVYQKLLKNHRVYLVGVHAPLEVIEQREKDRGDRALGLARSQIDIVHRDKTYDLEVNTHEQSLDQAVYAILDLMKNEQNPTGFFKK